MQNRKHVSILTSAYRLARSAKLLQYGWSRSAFVSCYFFYKRFWEDPFWGLIHRRPELFRNGDVLDIGANIGYTSCLFARAVEQKSKVYAFEPDQCSFHLLTEVVRRRKLSEKVVVMNTAVGSSDGSLEFWHNEKHSADHRVVTEHFRNSRPDSTKVTTVPATSVDSFVNLRNLEKLSFIKMDVQGYELAVCEGMRQTLARFTDVAVCVEYAPEALRELGFDPAALLRFFRTSGYQLHLLTRSSNVLAQDDAPIHRFAERDGYVDLLCSRSALA